MFAKTHFTTPGTPLKRLRDSFKTFPRPWLPPFSVAFLLTVGLALLTALAICSGWIGATQELETMGVYVGPTHA